jgi:signal recognition particle subunit SEC65
MSLLNPIIKSIIKGKSKTVKKDGLSQSSATEKQAEMLRQMSEDANNLKQRGFSDDRINELLEEAYDLGKPSDLKKALEKPIIRNNKADGGILQDDEKRIGYAAGPSEEEVEQMETRKHLKNVLGDKTANTLLTSDKDSPEFKQAFNKAVVEEGMGPDGLEFELNKLRGETPVIPKDDNRIIRAEGGSLLADDMAVAETHMMPDGTEMPGATHGEGEMMTDEAPEEDMAPDEEMEKEFLDFILDEALSPEEEDMLMSRLEQDEELAMLFDKVIDVAQEFAGSGPVEGPGSGVSDSIPARLSDGEFVFTAAAVEEIGADNLMAMMKEAEMKAKERQGLAEGGLPEEETVTMEVQEQKEPKVQIAKAAVNSIRGLLDEDEVSKGVKSNMMLDPLQRHVRS